MRKNSSFFECKWREQPGDFKITEVKAGFSRYCEVYYNADLDEEDKLAELKLIAEKYYSYHAASTYVNLSLLQLSPSASTWAQEVTKITSWYKNTMMIHGSPTFYYLANVYLQLAETESKTTQRVWLTEAYTYIQAGLALKDMCVDALYNAYLGRSFSDNQLRFDTPEKLKATCLQALREIKHIPDVASAKEKLVEQYLDKIHDHRYQHSLLLSEL